MTAWRPNTDTVISCAMTRGGNYLVVTAKGHCGVSDVPVKIGKRLNIRNGQLQVPKVADDA